MNSQPLIRWAGLSTAAAGLCFTALGLLHPANEFASITTTRWAIAHGLAITMALTGLAGLAGLHARQAQTAGWLGLAGYGLMSLWLVLMFPFAFFEALILPLLATQAPAVAAAFVGMFTNTPSAVDLGLLPALWSFSDILFLIGGLVLGIATFRAGTLSRWAAGLFTAGIAAAPIFGSLLPPAFEPLVAVPIGLGLAWLGWALWSERPAPAAQPAQGWEEPQRRRAGAQ